MQAGEPPSFVLQIVITLVGVALIAGVMVLLDKSITTFQSASGSSAMLVQDTTGDTSIIPQSP